MKQLKITLVVISVFCHLDALKKTSLAHDVSLLPDEEMLYHRCSFDDVFGLGRIFKVAGKYKEALRYFRVAVKQRPEYGPANWELGDVYMALGDYKKGYPSYWWRWEEKHSTIHRLWQGEDLLGKTILVHAQWGLGDTFQFVRYLQILKNQGAHIIFECQKPLVDLLSPCPFIDQLVTATPESIHCDYVIPITAIPYILNSERLETYPETIPYIFVEGAMQEYWKGLLESDTNFKIGICWQGTQRPDPQTALRPLPLKLLEPLFHLQGVSFYSLQRIDGLEQLEHLENPALLKTFDASFDKLHGAFVDTAAVMKNLDLVLTIDTSIMHLAGALGVPVWVMVPYAAEYRFYLHREDSPWYPTMRLFRQPRQGDWHAVVHNVKKALEPVLELHRSPLKALYSLFGKKLLYPEARS